MLTINVNQEAAATVKTWTAVKAYMQANGLRFAFVVSDAGEQFNVLIASTGWNGRAPTMRKVKV